ncbi:hypothetical protein XELAEV_18031525mg [Xenopus laevis]|uniref:Helix-turn-helix domain-containing protein n=1 Tax=Xenopus laevis TaxID=8355 RepID=A0A974CQ35_XENLA|nr:hypothetical protein XELAEV_18031525mg [Xenopus laevis]
MWDSFHPHHIKKSIVFSQTLKYNRICSNLYDRNKHLHSLRKTFVNQGYHPQVIDDQIHRATQLSRDSWITKKRQKTTGYRLKQMFPELPLLFYRQPPNPRKMIVRSALPKTTKADQVAIPNKQKVYTILDHYSCASSNVDMQVLILKENFKTEWERKIYEFKCMELFNTLRQDLNLGSGLMSH